MSPRDKACADFIASPAARAADAAERRGGVLDLLGLWVVGSAAMTIGLLFGLAVALAWCRP